MSQLEHMLREVLSLPGAQRELLVPLFITALQERAPKGSSLAPELLADADAFWKSLGDTPERRTTTLEQRLAAAGIGPELFRRLTVAAGIDDEPDAARHAIGAHPASRPAQKRAPAVGETKAGALARFVLQSVASKKM